MQRIPYAKHAPCDLSGKVGFVVTATMCDSVASFTILHLDPQFVSQFRGFLLFLLEIGILFTS